MKVILIAPCNIGSVPHEAGHDITDLPQVERDCLLNLGVATHCRDEDAETMVALIREDAERQAAEARAKEQAAIEAALAAAIVKPDTSDQIEAEPEPEPEPVPMVMAEPEPEDEPEDEPEPEPAPAADAEEEP